MKKHNRTIFERLFYKSRWNIGYINQTMGELLERGRLERVNWIAEDDSDYSADPFAIRYKDDVYVFYEDLKFTKGRGTLKYFELSNPGARTDVILSNESCHWSYPYLFEYNNEIYCIPETADLREVRLYKAILFPENWSMIKVLLRGPYVDSSIVQYDKKWWLFTTLSTHTGNGLYIYESETPFGKWEPHPENPVISSESGSRCAGHLFVNDGVLYRPAQDNSIDYGRSIIVNKVVTITSREYREVPALEIQPKDKYGHGIHTLSCAGSTIVVDGKRHKFSIWTPLAKLSKGVRRRYYRRINRAAAVRQP